MGVFRSGRDGPTRAELATRGLMLLGVFGVLLALMSASAGGAFADTSQVTTRLDTAGGAIAEGSDVKMAGLVVGRVSSITGDQDGVELGLTLDNEQIDGIPSTVKARILPASVFGTTFVDLVAQGDTDGRSLRAGDEIEQDTSVPDPGAAARAGQRRPAGRRAGPGRAQHHPHQPGHRAGGAGRRAGPHDRGGGPAAGQGHRRHAADP